MDAEARQPVVFLMGPTASGKTALAVELVQRGAPDGRGFEIVSVDSAMVYRGLDIGTAKPTADILAIAESTLTISKPRPSGAPRCTSSTASAVLPEAVGPIRNTTG